MSQSFASSARTDESARVESLIPSELRPTTQRLIGFIEEYYRYLNQNGLPSGAIAEITKNQDIDRASDVFLDAIGAEIAKTVPSGALVDKVNLYKKIVQYYSTRGTEDSIVVFFRIFFNEIVEIYYPKVDMLRVSDGKWNQANQEFENTDGFLSADKFLQDGEFYQEFSYLIRSALPLQDWELNFSKLVHPAGFKFFAEIALYLTVLGRHSSWLDTRTTGASYDDVRTGLKRGNPHEDLRILNFHSPHIQPGWLDAAERILKFIFTANSITPDMVRTVFLVLNMPMRIESWYRENLHASYDYLKVFDQTPANHYDDIRPLGPDGRFRPFAPEGRNFGQLGTDISQIDSTPVVRPSHFIFKSDQYIDDDLALKISGSPLYNVFDGRTNVSFYYGYDQLTYPEAGTYHLGVKSNGTPVQPLEAIGTPIGSAIPARLHRLADIPWDTAAVWTGPTDTGGTGVFTGSIEIRRKAAGDTLTYNAIGAIQSSIYTPIGGNRSFVVRISRRDSMGSLIGTAFSQSITASQGLAGFSFTVPNLPGTEEHWIEIISQSILVQLDAAPLMPSESSTTEATNNIVRIPAGHSFIANDPVFFPEWIPVLSPTLSTTLPNIVPNRVYYIHEVIDSERLTLKTTLSGTAAMTFNTSYEGTIRGTENDFYVDNEIYNYSEQTDPDRTRIGGPISFNYQTDPLAPRRVRRVSSEPITLPRDAVIEVFSMNGWGSGWTAPWHVDVHFTDGSVVRHQGGSNVSFPGESIAHLPEGDVPISQYPRYFIEGPWNEDYAPNGSFCLGTFTAPYLSGFPVAATPSPGTTFCIRKPDGVHVTWRLPASIAGFHETVHVLRNTSQDFETAETLETIPAVSTAVTHIDETADPGTEYWYWIKYENAGPGGVMGPVRADIDDPSADLGTDKILVHWSGTAAEYSVKLATQLLGPYSLVGTTSQNQMQITSLAPGTTYYVKVSYKTPAGHDLTSAALPFTTNT